MLLKALNPMPYIKRCSHITYTKMNNPTAIWWFLLWIIIMTFIIPAFLWFTMFTKSIILEWSILSLGPTEITFPVIMDPTSLTFSLTVLFITVNVLQFGSTYMQDELFNKRFVTMVILFVASMNLLIFTPHLIALLLGWDGLGITSFILVIYYLNPKSLAAGMITALTNRIGDAALLLSIGWSLSMGHWNVLNFFHTTDSYLAMIAITLAAMTKSAQMPFSSWLPAAMAAPTPVSALVHSSTLVTAGVFLLIRFHYFLSSFHYFKLILLIAATSTMLMAGITAISECDLKKIIALSTLSQLGVMMMSIALGTPNLAFFHLLTHALFKALLFVCAGTLIHYHHHGQDLRTMGMLMNQAPLTMSTLLTANLALCGFPFMAGFYSKDAIIESALGNPFNFTITFMLILATILTTSYSIRLTLTALTAPHLSLPTSYIHDTDTTTTTPMILLSLGAITGGAAINWLIMTPIQAPVLCPTAKYLPILMIITGATTAWIMTTSPLSQSIWRPLLTNMNSTMWFLTPISSQQVLSSTSALAHNLLKSVDQGWAEVAGGQGVFGTLKHVTSSLQTWQQSPITTHVSVMGMFSLVFMYPISQ